MSLNESPVNALNPYNAMKLYVYIFKRLDLKFSKIQFSDLLFCMYCIHCFYLCQFLYICLTSETLHYPWIPSLFTRGFSKRLRHSIRTTGYFNSFYLPGPCILHVVIGTVY